MKSNHIKTLAMRKFLSIIFINILFVLNSFSQQHKDCDDPLMLCGPSPFRIETSFGSGIEDSQVSNSCVMIEFSSIWIEINIMTAGDLVFEITPDDIMVDLDFIVFKIEDNDCESKSIIRCMASGITGGATMEENMPCLGATGLAFGETDVTENPGCTTGDNNFLAPLEAEEGDQYMIMISDFSESLQGYQINFSGTATIDCITTSSDDISKIDQAPLFSSSTIEDQLLVTTHSFDGQAKLQIYSLNGTTLFNQNIQENESVLVNNLTLGGMYLIVLNTNKSIVSEKVILVN